MYRTGVVLGIVLALSVDLLAADMPASNVEMARRLKEIASRVVVNPQAVFYRNDLYVHLLYKQQAETNESLGAGFHFAVSVQLLRAGRPQEALRELDRAAEMLRQEGQTLTADLRLKFDIQRGAYYLRLGEQENCLNNHSADSCLLPIRGAGVYKSQQAPRAAIEIYSRLLEQSPDDLSLLWLLNLAYQTIGEYPGGVPEPWRLPPEMFESDYEMQRHFDVAMKAGVADPKLSGGVVIEDFNTDGFLDLMTSSWGPSDQMRYFESKGDGTFVDRTVEVGLEGLTGGLNLIHSDFDNDGRPDVLVLRGAWLDKYGDYPNSLLRNREDGVFEDVTVQAGLLRFRPTQTAAWGDFDNDGYLDLFVGNESQRETYRCALYRNNGDGTFTDVAADVGLNHQGFVKAAVWGDYDNDGLLDLYLSKLFESNVLYRNLGSFVSGAVETGNKVKSWRFEDVTVEAGVGLPIKSFPAWFFDYDNDGWLDLLVATFADFTASSLETVVADYLDLPRESERCRLYHNEGNGTFSDVSREMNVDRALLVMGANFGDIDNDGYLDMYLGTGQPAMTTLIPNIMLRNAEGARFQDVTTSGGFGHLQKGHGIAFGDLDNDGDQDIYAVMGGAYSGDVYPNALFENPGIEGHHWITLQFEGREANRLAVGGRVRLTVEDAQAREREIHRVVGTGGSFGSSSLQLEVGLGEAARIVSLDVVWPGSGRRSHFDDVPMDTILRVREGEASFEVVNVPRIGLAKGSVHPVEHHDSGPDH